LVQETIVMAVQINWKVRWTIEISPDAFQDDAMALVKWDEKISKHIFSEPKKIIYLKGKILNIVV
jgi:leucyl-tRNA synthetase